ncbi:hypothetical protein LA080_013570 [Diaporthe eres]|nr:hypothetical protein LA080_013570 [Diaporthe eres]
MHQNLESTVTWLSPDISIQGCLKQIAADVAALAAQLSSAQLGFMISGHLDPPISKATPCVEVPLNLEWS